MCRETGDGQGCVVVGGDQPALRRSAMSTITVRALRAAVVVPLLAASALVASVGHASATINTNNTDRPKISAGDRDFGNKDFLGFLSGGIVNWDETDSGTRSTCPKFTPWISGILYLNNLSHQSTRVEVDYHDSRHNELYTWDSASFMPVDNKKHEYVISDAVYGSYDLDHIIIKIDAFENGSWKTKGTAVEYRPLDCTDDYPPIGG
jgi:hypothetical protein